MSSAETVPLICPGTQNSEHPNSSTQVSAPICHIPHCTCLRPDLLAARLWPEFSTKTCTWKHSDSKLVNLSPNHTACWMAHLHWSSICLDLSFALPDHRYRTSVIVHSAWLLTSLLHLPTDGWAGWVYLSCYISRWFMCPQMVTCPSSNWLT